MGSGKSSLGKKLAATLRYDFADTDQMIEMKLGKTISEIFSEQGEKKFRKLEQEALHDTTQLHKMVIATGGGLPAFHNNMKTMNDAGVTLYLQCSIPFLTSRLKEKKADRPLLQNLQEDDLMINVTRLLEIRKPYYLEAKLIYDIPNTSVETIIKSIL